jgi:hypothetical protein
MSSRGQAHTLEAITASILLIGGLVFALQATAVTPLSASTSSQHIENQQRATAQGVLAAATDRGALKVAVLNWNESAGEFYGAPGNESYYQNTAPNNTFGDISDRAFADRGIVYNVYVEYERSDGRRTKQRMVYRGEPSDNAVTATTMVTLTDDDVLYDENAMATDTTVQTTSDFYAPDTSSSTGLYNVVEVEVVVWRQ